MEQAHKDTAHGQAGPAPADNAQGQARPDKAGLPGALHLQVDLDALVRNWRCFSGQAKPGDAGRPVCAAVVKADAYGLGLARCARALHKAGCRHFFVARTGEGIALRRVCGGDTQIYVLEGYRQDEQTLFAEHGLAPVINSMEEAGRWARSLAGMAHAARMAQPFALHFDTAMNRLGLAVSDVGAICQIMPLMSQGRGLVMSHLACADDPSHACNARQKEMFDTVAGKFPGWHKSLANSAGVFLGPAFHHEMIRPGIGLYGGQCGPRAVPMAPVARLVSPVVQTRTVERGETIGYGAAFTAPRRMRLAILSLGYADGYFRALGGYAGGGCGEVFLCGQRAPVVGRVSMDLTAIDISHIAEKPCAPGTMCEVFGPRIRLSELAERSGTLDYEILTRITARVARHYHSKAQTL